MKKILLYLSITICFSVNSYSQKSIKNCMKEPCQSMFDKLPIYQNFILETANSIDVLWKNLGSEAKSKNKLEYEEIANQIRQYYAFISKEYTCNDFETSSVLKYKLCSFGDELDKFYNDKFTPFFNKVSNEEYKKYNPK